jgi:hypothetical protein
MPKSSNITELVVRGYPVKIFPNGIIKVDATKSKVITREYANQLAVNITKYLHDEGFTKQPGDTVDKL